jgi:hypothetical protein
MIRFGPPCCSTEVALACKFMISGHADWCSVLTTAQRLDAQSVLQIWLDSSSLVSKGLPMSVPGYGAFLSNHEQRGSYQLARWISTDKRASSDRPICWRKADFPLPIWLHCRSD